MVTMAVSSRLAAGAFKALSFVGDLIGDFGDLYPGLFGGEAAEVGDPCTGLPWLTFPPVTGCSKVVVCVL